MIQYDNDNIEFLKTFATIGADIAAYGGPDWEKNNNFCRNDGNFGSEDKRRSVVGSPVVPITPTKVVTIGDSHMYKMSVLKGHYLAGKMVGDDFSQGNKIFNILLLSLLLSLL